MLDKSDSTSLENIWNQNYILETELYKKGITLIFYICWKFWTKCLNNELIEKPGWNYRDRKMFEPLREMSKQYITLNIEGNKTISRTY